MAEYGAGVNVPDLMFVDAAVTNWFQCKTINNLGSDHLPILIKAGLCVKA